jgi:aminoglycoside phosphotransferase (APT) family kinase protein
MSLHDKGLNRLAMSLGASGASEVRRLSGGAACDVHLVELTVDGTRRPVVVKTFPGGAGSARWEWAALGVARAVPVATPEPLALDAEGAWFGISALVMSYLPGRLVTDADDQDRWTAGLAQGLVGVHATRVTALPASMHRPAIWDRWSPDGLASDPRARVIASSISLLRERPWERGLCHGDFRSGNVLFVESGLSGVVDWMSSRHAPLLSDVGRCRIDLRIWPGGHASELFTTQYQRLSGRLLDGLAYWDLLAGSIYLEHGRQSAGAYHAMGVELAPDQALDRASAAVDRALDELS